MTEKEMKRLKRAELLEMLVEQMKENERLKEQLREKEEELQNRKIKIDQAGSIAEAALALNGVFEAAQAAAQQYLESIQQESGDKT